LYCQHLIGSCCSQPAQQPAPQVCGAALITGCTIFSLQWGVQTPERHASQVCVQNFSSKYLKGQRKKVWWEECESHMLLLWFDAQG
jgi:hypothetical protein